MIYSEETLEPQIAQLLIDYPNLVVVQSTQHFVRLYGSILVYRSYNGYTLHKTYALEIVIPIGSDDLPFVIDVGRQISQTYKHYYPQNGKLCLETDSRIRIRFISGFDLSVWMREFVESYYFSYEYYERYNEFPFGERSHGQLGILQTYMDLLKTKDAAEAYRLISYINDQAYRGHNLCPCNSNLKLRNCHGQYILPFYIDIRMRMILKNDLLSINQELEISNANKQHI